MRQPYLKYYKKNFSNYQNVEKVHNFGYYIGNSPYLEKKRL